MISLDPRVSFYQPGSKQPQTVAIGDFKGQSQSTSPIIERRKQDDRRQHRQAAKKFDRRQVTDRRRAKIDLSI